MYASDYSWTKIFFNCFNTFSLSDSIVIRPHCRSHLCTCKPGKSSMFSAEVKTKASKGNDSVERKWFFFWPVSFKIQLLEVTFKPVSIANRNVLGEQSFVFRTLLIWFHWCAKWLLIILIALKIDTCVSTWCADLNTVHQNWNLCIIINRPAVAHHQEHWAISHPLPLISDIIHYWYVWTDLTVITYVKHGRVFRGMFFSYLPPLCGQAETVETISMQYQQ